jgi:hypothetical protein
MLLTMAAPGAFLKKAPDGTCSRGGVIGDPDDVRVTFHA